MGRRRDTGSERWATVTEAAEALGVTGQAIYNRIKASTIPYEQEIDEGTGRPSYRIDREWLEREVARKGEVATQEVAQQRTMDITTAFSEGVETLRAEIEKTRGTINPAVHSILEAIVENRAQVKGAIEEQVRQVVPRLDALTENQRALYEQILEAVARAENAQRMAQEAGEREQEYQQANLELVRELRDLAAEAKHENNEARAGRIERRVVSRRFVYVATAVLVVLVLVAVALIVLDIYVHMTP